MKQLGYLIHATGWLLLPMAGGLIRANLSTTLIVGSIAVFLIGYGAQCAGMLSYEKTNGQPPKRENVIYLSPKKGKRPSSRCRRAVS